jgi:hypothetical protein
MTTFYGMFTVDDLDTPVNTVGQEVVYDRVQQVVAAHNANLARLMSVFVSDQATTVFQEEYALPGGGYMQDLDEFGRPAATKPGGSWTVAYPLWIRGDQKAFTQRQAALMTVRQMGAFISDTLLKDTNTRRRDLLRTLFRNVNYTFKDPNKNGNLGIKALANGDGTLYPPMVDSDAGDEAEAQHYITSGYAASAISDTNNPIVTLVALLKVSLGAGNPAVFVRSNSTALTKIKALADYVPVRAANIQTGSGQSVAINPPTDLPGMVVGYCDGAWIVEYDWIPANYLLIVDLAVPGPIKIRVDPALPGLTRGLTLAAQDLNFPIQSLYYTNVYGMGVANRLNGAVMELTADATYDIPTGSYWS